MSIPLALCAAPIEGFDNNKNLLTHKRNKTIKREPFSNPASSTLENLDTTINKIKSIHESQQEDTPELANFMKEYQHAAYNKEPLPPPKMVTNNPDIGQGTDLNNSVDENTTKTDFALMESDYQQITNNPNKYYGGMVDSYNPHNTNTKDETLQKLDKLIHLFEEQRDLKSGSVTEELILYSFLGVFIIYVLDSFVKVGKYTR